MNAIIILHANKCKYTDTTEVKTMKKLTAAVCAMVIALSMAGCGSGGLSSKNTIKTAKALQAPARAITAPQTPKSR